MTFTIVVPLPPDHVVVLTSVLRLVTDFPVPPVALRGVHCDTVLLLVVPTGAGDTSFLHDGVGHAYLGYRETSEGYASLGIRY